ncbi:MAG: C40 family peptidase [Nitrososphaerota archaeon]|nr:C40 family peptidase [Nitrososphaerota archaeon]
MKRVNFGVVDLRRGPRFRSERTSQLIYGEGVKVLGSEEGYLRVVGADGYEGYVQKTLLGVLDGERAFKLAARFVGDGVQLPFGSYLSEAEAKSHGIPKKLLVPIERKFDPTALAERFLGVPYLWGGTSDFGYDCSGFTQRLFRYSGKELPRNAGWQRDAGARVKDFDHARRGDLVFFSGHVAMHLGGRKIIHANLRNGGVSVTDLSDGSEYSRYLMTIFQGIRRFEGANFTG